MLDNQNQDSIGPAESRHEQGHECHGQLSRCLSRVHRRSKRSGPGPGSSVRRPDRYRENCVGFTRGYVDWEHARASIERVWKGLPDLHVDLPHIMTDGDVALAHGIVRGTATGRLYGAPATKRSCEVSFFDYVRVEDQRIVERIQQADVLGQMRQLYGKTLGVVGLSAMFFRL